MLLDNIEIDSHSFLLFKLPSCFDCVNNETVYVNRNIGISSNNTCIMADNNNSSNFIKLSYYIPDKFLNKTWRIYDVFYKDILVLCETKFNINTFENNNTLKNHINKFKC